MFSTLMESIMHRMVRLQKLQKVPAEFDQKKVASRRARGNSLDVLASVTPNDLDSRKVQCTKRMGWIR